MTLLTVSVFADSIEKLETQLRDAVAGGAQLIEFRTDLMPDIAVEDLRQVRSQLPDTVRVIATARSAQEGGSWPRSEVERIEHIERLAEISDIIDVELFAWQQSDAQRNRILQTLNLDSQHPKHLVLSRHDFQDRPPALQSDFVQLIEAAAGSVPKIAWQARTVRDNFEAFDLLRLSPRPAIVICMGPFGELSRILAAKFGAFATFAALSREQSSAPGQVPLEDMVNLYHCQQIDARTVVYGVIGDPVAHSLSPHVHNAALREAGVNGVYVPIRVRGTYESFKAFMVEVLARPWLDFRGFSVTTPHKQNALRFVNESGGTLDPSAERVGAVNTLSIDGHGTVHGSNTDEPAAVSVVADATGRTWLDGLRVLVLGAGGVSRAVVSGLSEAGASIVISNRTASHAESLAGLFGCETIPWDLRNATEADLVVNCTSVGMWPETDFSPFQAAEGSEARAVFDTVYNPLKTKMLRDAQVAGWRTIDGLGLFAAQAAAQFETWTGRTVEVDFFRSAALDRLKSG